MTAQEHIVDILVLHQHGYTPTEIARRVQCDPRTVRRYLANPALLGKPVTRQPRGSKLDPYRALITEWLTEDPDFQASTICRRLQQAGYPGGYTLVKDAVQAHKEARQRLAYVRFETEPGQQAQVDFGDFQVRQPNGTTRTYYLFCMILGHSRMLYAELLERCDLVSFLEAHQRAFACFGGAPREILYDRMRNVYLRRLHGQPQFTQGLQGLAVHYGFRPLVAPAYAPWVKGKVERPMDYVREDFWRGYALTTLAQANTDLQAWLAQAALRVHGTTRQVVQERFLREQPALLALPPTPCDVSLRLTREVRKDCRISVDGNAYLVSHRYVGMTVTVRLHHTTLRVYDDATLLATYAVPAGRGHVVGDAAAIYAAVRADRAMNARKYAHPLPGKGRATRSPLASRYPVEVTTRPLTDYDAIGGGIGYA
jgi:transposase